MSGFAAYTKRRNLAVPGHFERAAKAQRWRVVRHDGVVLAGSAEESAAHRICRVVCHGQPEGYATVIRGGR